MRAKASLWLTDVSCHFSIWFFTSRARVSKSLPLSSMWVDNTKQVRVENHSVWVSSAMEKWGTLRNLWKTRKVTSCLMRGAWWLPVGEKQIIAITNFGRSHRQLRAGAMLVQVVLFLLTDVRQLVSLVLVGKAESYSIWWRIQAETNSDNVTPWTGDKCFMGFQERSWIISTI